jgi:hypothetical protein
VQTSQIPQTGFLSLRQILGDKKTNTPPIIPVGPTTWWNGVKSGRYPKGFKVSANRTAWRVEDIRLLVSTLTTSS